VKSTLSFQKRFAFAFANLPKTKPSSSSFSSSCRKAEGFEDDEEVNFFKDRGAGGGGLKNESDNSEVDRQSVLCV
jgi:hypothetical protein